MVSWYSSTRTWSKRAADILGNSRLGHHLRPVEQQVVVIEDVLRLLGFHIGSEEFAQLLFPAGAPGEVLFQHRVERRFRIHRPGIDGKAGALGREAAFRLRETELVADEVHQVGGIFPVVDGEIRIESYLFGMQAQDAGADAVERAGPGERVGDGAGLAAEHLGADALDAAAHFGGGAAGEGHQQDAARIGTGDDQMRDAVGERVGLAGTGAGDHQKRAGRAAVRHVGTVLDRAALRLVQFFQIRNSHVRSRCVRMSHS